MGLTLLRHTAPLVAPGICYGRTDLELAPSFPEELERISVKMPVVAHVFTSPLQRCRRLAEALCKTHGLSLKIEPRIREMDFGAWEGQAWSDISRDEIDAWADDFLHARPHGGESVAMLRARALAALEDIRGNNQPTLLVTHAGIIKAAFATGDESMHFQTQIGFGEYIPLPTLQGSFK